MHKFRDWFGRPSREKPMVYDLFIDKNSFAHVIPHRPIIQGGCSPASVNKAFHKAKPYFWLGADAEGL